MTVKKKLVTLTVVFVAISAMFLNLVAKAHAQSPIQCGLIGEPCCNLAGSPPDSCKTGLQCSNGSCIAIPGQSPPPPRGGTPPPVLLEMQGDCGNDSISTAIGCIPVLGSTNEFLSSILSWAVGVGSGIAFLLMLYAGFMIMTATGNPERIKAGQELLTSAIAGLILLIFAVFILRFIGVDILGLDAFGFGN